MRMAIAALLVVAVMLSGCLASYPNLANNTMNRTNGTVQIANPAAQDCVLKGYRYEIRADANGGQYGVCSKPGYTECEEWALFRGECSIVQLGANVSANATGMEPRAEGQFCGGIAAIPCQEGLHCRLEASYPDAGGKCLKDCNCTLMTDGTAVGCFGCAFDEETGSFNCTGPASANWQHYERAPGAIGIPYACYCDNGACKLAQ